MRISSALLIFVFRNLHFRYWIKVYQVLIFSFPGLLFFLLLERERCHSRWKRAAAGFAAAVNIYPRLGRGCKHGEGRTHWTERTNSPDLSDTEVRGSPKPGGGSVADWKLTMPPPTSFRQTSRWQVSVVTMSHLYSGDTVPSILSQATSLNPHFRVPVPYPLANGAPLIGHFFF